MLLLISNNLITSRGNIMLKTKDNLQVTNAGFLTVKLEKYLYSKDGTITNDSFKNAINKYLKVAIDEFIKNCTNLNINWSSFTVDIRRMSTDNPKMFKYVYTISERIK